MNEANIINNLKTVKSKIKKAALKSERKPEAIKILAVSKNHSIEDIKTLRKAGIDFFGESRVQELEEKNQKLLEEKIELDWHFIGHLQRNKVKYLMRMDNCQMIESIDSLRLAKEINKRAVKNNRTIPVLIQINIAEDDNKYGIKQGKAESFIKKMINLENIKVKGLMTILPYLDDSEKLRNYFRDMKKLYDNISTNIVKLNELSMGMSNDYQIAVEEGATIVRVGRAIFGEREY